MSNIIPLISSGTAGPLGVLHLPRLWQKVSLAARGKLADGYKGPGPGYDYMVIEALGLDKDSLVAFITDSRPTYAAFEAWVASQPGAKLDAASVGALNSAISGYNHTDDVRASILAAAGIPNDSAAPKDAVNLNNLDDWSEFHAAELA
ncbi:MAG: DUF5069 domain-containing protein [Verrucomicrobiales bacterium]